jgi:hypothetical protein
MREGNRIISGLTVIGAKLSKPRRNIFQRGQPDTYFTFKCYPEISLTSFLNNARLPILKIQAENTRLNFKKVKLINKKKLQEKNPQEMLNREKREVNFT